MGGIRPPGTKAADAKDFRTFAKLFDRGVVTTGIERNSSMRAWLKRDAINRAWRAFLQAITATVLLPAADAAGQVIQLAFANAAAGKGFDWDQVMLTAKYSAGVGVTMAVLSYLHRRVLDPSPIPSAEPPTPPLAAVSPPKWEATPR